MNNSFLTYESVPLNLEELDNSEALRDRQATLLRIIGAIDIISKEAEWSTLKKEIFENRIQTLEKQLKAESESHDIQDSVLYRLQGRIFEARKYNLEKLREDSLLELNKIKLLIKPQPTER